jgi:hypothetical protein
VLLINAVSVPAVSVTAVHSCNSSASVVASVVMLLLHCHDIQYELIV